MATSANRQVVSLKNLKVRKFIDNSDKPISVLVGLLAGVPIAVAIDKSMTAKKVFGMDGDKLKKWVKPGANFILGMSVNFLAKDQRLKLAGVGLAANGGLIALKDLLGGKDLLKGLIDDVGDVKSVGNTTVHVLEQAASSQPTAPLNIPLLDVDEPGDTGAQIIDNALDEEPENIEGTIEAAEEVSGSPNDGMGNSGGIIEAGEEELDLSEIP